VKNISADDLEKEVGKYIAIAVACDGKSKYDLSERDVIFVRVIDASRQNHSIIVEKINSEDIGTKFCFYYEENSSVEVYDEDESVLMAFTDYSGRESDVETA
jgi:hypothetical protein